MTDGAGSASTGGDLTSSDPAAGGIPTESEAPELHGLGDNVSDPSDPRNEPSGSERAPFDPGSTPGDAAAPSDPMPDISGTSG